MKTNETFSFQFIEETYNSFCRYIASIYTPIMLLWQLKEMVTLTKPIKYHNLPFSFANIQASS